MNKTILKILYDVEFILYAAMVVLALITKQLDIALLGLILVKLCVDDRTK